MLSFLRCAYPLLSAFPRPASSHKLVLMCQIAIALHHGTDFLLRESLLRTVFHTVLLSPARATTGRREIHAAYYLWRHVFLHFKQCGRNRASNCFHMGGVHDCAVQQVPCCALSHLRFAQPVYGYCHLVYTSAKCVSGYTQPVT